MSTKVIYTAVVGSTMHGLRTENSDEDVRYVTMPSLRDIISPFKNEEIKVRNNKGEDEESWDLAHFCKYLTHGNPTIYEVIRTNHYDKNLPFADKIRSLMPLAFDGRKILLAHIGYCEAQLARYLRRANDDFCDHTGKQSSNKNYEINTLFNFYHSEEELEIARLKYSSKKVEFLTDIWEENKLRRLPKAIVAGYRVLAQARQLLETGDFEPVVKEYSQTLHDKLMDIKTMDASKITWGFIKEHIDGLENGIQDLKMFYETLPDAIKNKKPDINGIEDVLCEIYGV